MRLRLARRGAGIILKYEWRLDQGYYPTLKLPPTYIQKAPGSSPIWGGEAGGYLSYSLLQKQ